MTDEQDAHPGTAVTPRTFSAVDFRQRCDQLAARDPDLAAVIDRYGYPPLWSRPNTFETLVHIILEQQVSVASARAALERLRQTIGVITPERVLMLSDQALKQAYFSRQKISYSRGLAEAVLAGRLELTSLEHAPDDEVRTRLVQLKGIGNWTADIYLMMVLHRLDVFPHGDLAAMSALRRLKDIPATASQDILAATISVWQPQRTIATMLLWHYYLAGSKKPLSG